MPSSPDKNHRGLGAEAIRSEVAAVVSSASFSKSDRHCRFLQYVVEKALNGNAGDLKEYSIAIEVFRRSSYDPQVDSLVRVEAAKLRARLRKYYESEGRKDSILIEIPKGGYVPVFSHRSAEPAAVFPVINVFLRPVVGAAAIAVLGLAVLLISASRTHEPHFANLQIRRLTDSGKVHQATISPDGQYAAYVTGRAEGRESLWIKHIATGSELQLVPEEEAFFMGSTFSPDSSYVYYGVHPAGQKMSSLYKTPVIGGEPIRLMDRLDSPISFSPDGASFAFVREDASRGESALFIARTGVSEAALTASERKLLSRQLPEFLDYPAWSPDGKYVACTSVHRAAAFTSLVRVRVSDGAERPMGSRKWGIVKGLAWLGGVTDTIVFAARAQNADFTQIWRYRVGANEPRPVTNDLSNYAQMSSSKGAPTLVTINERTLASIWVSEDANSTNARMIASSEIDQYCRVSWTRDGQLLHHRQSGPQDQLWLMQPDGSNARHLTFDAAARGTDGEARDAAVCGQGGDIVFLVSRAGENQIWKIDAAGTHSRMLIGATDETHPQCSPDGEWVLFTRTGSNLWPMLWRVSTNGGAPQRLNTGWSSEPVISPDGHSIAVFYEESPGTLQVPPQNIAIIPSQGGKPIRTFRIGQGIAQSAGLRWVARGNALSYVEMRSGAANIWIQPLDGGPSLRATNFTGDQIAAFDWSSDGRRLAFVRVTVKRDLVLLRGVHFAEL
jgi:Tol biopolymer transport system component